MKASLKNVSVGDYIISNNRRWLVEKLLKARVMARCETSYGSRTNTWYYDGRPATAAYDAHPETEEERKEFEERAQRLLEARKRQEEQMQANHLVQQAVNRLWVLRNPYGEAPLAKAWAFHAFVERLLDATDFT